MRESVVGERPRTPGLDLKTADRGFRRCPLRRSACYLGLKSSRPDVNNPDSITPPLRSYNRGRPHRSLGLAPTDRGSQQPNTREPRRCPAAGRVWRSDPAAAHPGTTGATGASSAKVARTKADRTIASRRLTAASLRSSASSRHPTAPQAPGVPPRSATALAVGTRAGQKASPPVGRQVRDVPSCHTMAPLVPANWAGQMLSRRARWLA